MLRRVAETPRALAARRVIEPGATLGDRFIVERKLGAGGMGQVFAVFDPERQTRVAAKVLGWLSAESIAQIKHEFRVAEAIVHENLVRLHELFSDRDLWFFTMDLVDGVMLPVLLGREPSRRRAPGFLREIFRQLAVALNALHATSMIHRDLKPSNFLLTRAENRVVLLDFGLARPPDLGERGDRAGTPMYMAPEQALGEAPTEAADWYSFGVVLHEALTGQLPVARRTPGAPMDAPDGLGELCGRLLALDPNDRPSGTEVLQALGHERRERGRRSTNELKTGLIGREDELAALQSALARTRAGVPAVVRVTGTSGIGKSVLLQRFAEIARGQGALVLRGRCRERESIAFKAVDGLVDCLIRLFESLPEQEVVQLLPPSIGDLTVVFPALGAVPAVARLKHPQLVADRGIRRQLAVAAFVELIARLRRRAPLVICLDDAQWSDRESALLLAPLLRVTDAGPLLLVISERGGANNPGPLVEALYGDGSPSLPTLENVALGPVSEASGEQIALAMLDVPSVDRVGVARRISREARGHPLFIAELAHTAGLRDQLDRPSPSTLTDLLAARMEPLSSMARRFLQVVSVAGGPVARGLVRRATGVSLADAHQVVDLLRSKHLLRSDGLTDADAVDTHHDRVREIVLRRLTDGERRLSHLHLARTLEADPGTALNQLAAHFEAAGELEKAGSYWLAAADAAMRSLAFAKAADLYQKALEHAQLSIDDRRIVLRKQAEALVHAGRGVAAAEVFLDLASHAPADESLELRRAAAEQLLLAGHFERGMSAIDEVLTAVGMSRARRAPAALAALAIGRLRLRARGLRHMVRREETVRRIELARLDASWTIACSLGSLDFLRGAEFQSKHLLTALKAGEPKRLLRALTLEVAFAATPGPGSKRRTERLLKIADELAEKTSDDSAASLRSLTCGIAAYLQSHLPEAQKYLEEAIYLLSRRSAGAVWEMVTAQRFLVACLFFLGKIRRLCEFIPPLLAEAEHNGNLYGTMCFRAGYSTLAWLAGDSVDAARAHLERARAEWDVGSFQLSHFNLLLGEVFTDLYAGDGLAAHRRIERGWSETMKAQLHRIAILRVQGHHLRGALTLTASVEAQRRRQFSQARDLRTLARKLARRLARENVHRAGPLACSLTAAIEHADGAHEEAGSLLRKAISGFEEQGMRLFAAASRARLGALLAGDEGALLREGAYVAFRDEAVADPSRMIDVMAPGFDALAERSPGPGTTAGPRTSTGTLAGAD
ncbi:MAG TPA: AAA family ATPase [Acidobacteriaceae bacterium]|nr:AAA family ATPase [Acidobacteriaceae bacterium]